MSRRAPLGAFLARNPFPHPLTIGFFYREKRFFARAWLWFGYLYLAVMIARALLLWDHPIPIVFHWVLAAFVITVGLSHRRRLAQ